MLHPLGHLPRRLATALAMATLLAAVAVPSVHAQDDLVVITSTLEPATLEVTPGTTVTWRNDDGERHRLRSREGPEDFDSGNLEPGETFTFTFALEGTYPYIDERDDEDAAYFGTVIVSSSPDASTGTDGVATSGSVTIGDRVFIPATLDVATGATVEWTNADSDSHTATASDGAFDSGIMAPGATYSTTFDQPGRYPYFCAIHPDMKGTIDVSGPAVGASPAAGAVSGAAPETASPAGSAPTPSPSPTASASASPRANPIASPDGSASARPSAAASRSEDPSASADGSAAASPSVERVSATVSMAGRAFEPPAVEIPVGGGVDWINDDEDGHTVTAAEGAFDSGILAPGAAFTWTFDVAGTYDYFCAIHPDMQGTVVVTGASDTSGASVATASPSSSPLGG